MKIVPETRILVNFYNLLDLELNGLKPNDPRNNILLDVLENYNLGLFCCSNQVTEFFMTSIELWTIIKQYQFVLVRAFSKDLKSQIHVKFSRKIIQDSHQEPCHRWLLELNGVENVKK